MKTLDFFKNKTILITGGTGSFGWAAVQRLLDFDLRQIRIFSRDTKKQAKMERCLHQANPESAKKVTFWPGDILDLSSLEKAIEGVDCLIHAAALKQVPDCERFPIQAVQINVLGTENVLRTAVAAGVKKIVCLSTDKAAYVLGYLSIISQQLLRIFWQTITAISETWIVVVCADPGVQAYTVNDLPGVQPLGLCVRVQFVKISNTQGQIGVGKKFYRLCLCKTDNRNVNVLFERSYRLKDVPSPFLGITAIYCFVYFINNYILCFLTHFNVLVLNSF